MSSKCPFKNLIEPPKVKGVPLIHSLPNVALNLLDFLVNIRNKHGDVVQYKIFGINNYLVSHPDQIAQAFKDEKKGVFVKRKLHQALYPAFGNGLFNSHGDDWSKQRKELQPFFKKSYVSKWFPLIVSESLSQFEKFENVEINAEIMVKPLMENIMSFILFGLSSSHKESKKLIESIDLVSEKLSEHSVKSFIFGGLLNRLPTRGNLRYKKALKLIDKSILEISKNKNSKNSLLSLFSGFMTEKELRDQLFTFYFAGQDTTVSTLLWVIYHLANHPEHQEKARSEVLKKWKNKKEINFDDLDSFEFLNAAIDESMRLTPAAYATYRDIEKDTEIDGYKLKKNTLLALSMYVTHRHPDLWEKPLEYRPERFLGRNNKGYSFYPYGGGMRVCIGMHLAKMEITTVIALFIINFRFTLKKGACVKGITHLTLKPNSMPLSISRIKKY